MTTRRLWPESPTFTLPDVSKKRRIRITSSAEAICVSLGDWKVSSWPASVTFMFPLCSNSTRPSDSKRVRTSRHSRLWEMGCWNIWSSVCLVFAFRVFIWGLISSTPRDGLPLRGARVRADGRLGAGGQKSEVGGWGWFRATRRLHRILVTTEDSENTAWLLGIGANTIIRWRFGNLEP